MTPIWINKEAYKDPIDHYAYGWFGQVTPIVKVVFDDPHNPPYLVDRNGRHWTWRDNLISDENSSPYFLRTWFPTNYGLPSCFNHDQSYQEGWLYTRTDINQEWEPRKVTRPEADGIIYDGWIAAGVTGGRAKMALCVLRSFGWLTWKGRSKQPIPENS